jgi:hypothetical protein
MNKNIILVIGAILIALGLLKPDLSNIGLWNRPVAIDVLEIQAPSDPNIKDKADKVVEIITSVNDHKNDSRRLRDLYIDLGKLIQLDGEDEVVTSTEEIRQTNRLSGLMLKLDIKGKYKDLASASQAVIVEAIGDDNIPLSKDLRAKAVDAFNALAWAYNTGAK